MTTPSKPRRVSPPQHKAGRCGVQRVPYQHDPWTTPGWLPLALLAAGLLLAVIATLAR